MLDPVENTGCFVVIVKLLIKVKSTWAAWPGGSAVRVVVLYAEDSGSSPVPINFSPHCYSFKKKSMYNKSSCGFHAVLGAGPWQD